jgi:opacity protein-like surface antigen
LIDEVQMNGIARLAFILLFFTISLAAQEMPRVEIFGGYALARIDDSQGLTGGHINQNGWNAAVAVNINKYMGGVADFGGYYGTHRLPPFTALTCPTCPMTTPSPFQASTKFHTFMFGPQVSFRLHSVTPFLHALFGAAHEHGELVPSVASVSSSASGFAWAAGGGVDINFAHRFAYRVQGDFMRFSLIKFQPDENNWRFSTGLVFRFGG